jgi:hypothetical protein
MTGGSGNDEFGFGLEPGFDFGQDQISDFDTDPTDGQDLLNIAGLGITAATFGTEVSIGSDGAGGTLITIGGNTITLNLVDPVTVTSADFILAV